MEILRRHAEPWRVALIDTGENTQTGGRLRRVRDYVHDEDFCFTYGDGVCNVDIGRLIAFHRSQQTIATLTAVQPPGRFGSVDVEGGLIQAFREKPQGDGAWINGGFFVLSPRVMDYLEGDDTVWERCPMERLASEGQLSAYQHDGFWQCMDTMRDKILLEGLWQSGKAPWKIW
jgi:glucose-1-phosphate cytidylyltransferase